MMVSMMVATMTTTKIAILFAVPTLLKHNNVNDDNGIDDDKENGAMMMTKMAILFVVPALSKHDDFNSDDNDDKENDTMMMTKMAILFATQELKLNAATQLHCLKITLKCFKFCTSRC